MIQQLKPTAIDPDLIYPESDGKPLADNTLQFELIVKIQGCIDGLFADTSDVFVAGDLFWYPVEGSLTRQAPDVMVAFGRPRGYRGSYRQWEEGNIAPQVVFEILSKSNRRKEMERKFEFYQTYGVEEYYVYDPKKNKLKIWVQSSQGKDLENHSRLVPVEQTEGWVSPRLGIRFETCTGILELYRPDGTRFTNFVETLEQSVQAVQRAEQEAQRAEQEAQARHQAIARLLSLGLTVEQVAEALGFSVEDVQQRRNL
jgi:Uma2 family endonuclease